MKVLVIGGAGYVGGIIRPALEQQHDCTYYDLKPVVGAEARSIVGDINNEALLKGVLDQGKFDAVMHLAMGVNPQKEVNDANLAFAVNVCGTYQAVRFALGAGVRRIVFASTLSVYDRCSYRPEPTPWSEAIPADCWAPYGFSKRVAEFVLQAAAQRYPDSVITALRLMMPRNNADWQKVLNNDPQHRHASLGPQDTTRLFLAALQVEKPGCHIIQATGDIDGAHWDLRRAQDILGWKPQRQ